VVAASIPLRRALRRRRTRSVPPEDPKRGSPRSSSPKKAYKHPASFSVRLDPVARRCA
jgi:hypothetical protein